MHRGPSEANWLIVFESHHLSKVQKVTQNWLVTEAGMQVPAISFSMAHRGPPLQGELEIWLQRERGLALKLLLGSWAILAKFSSVLYIYIYDIFL